MCDLEQINLPFFCFNLRKYVKYLKKICAYQLLIKYQILRSQAEIGSPNNDWKYGIVKLSQAGKQVDLGLNTGPTS